MAERSPEDGPQDSDASPAGVDVHDPEALRFRGAEPHVEDSVATPPEGVYRDIVVIGASAGGVEALDNVVAGLPPDLPAAVFVVLHLSPGGRSVLPAILARAGPLPASVPEDGKRLERGHIYVAPPDRHLLVVGRRVRVTGGPRENGHRPAIDPLFRSAARSYGPRVVALVLSGNLDDGAAGARFVKDRGGVVVVQDPADALYPDMPSSAVAMVDVDAVVSTREIPPLLCQLLEEPVEDGAGRDDDAESDDDQELAAAELALDGHPTELSCPECGGPLWERSEGPLVRFSCRVGHVFSPESMMAQHGQRLERALWSAQRSLEERADLYRRMARRARERPLLQRRFLDRSASAEQHATAVQDAIAKLTSSGELEEMP